VQPQWEGAAGTRNASSRASNLIQPGSSHTHPAPERRRQINGIAPPSRERLDARASSRDDVAGAFAAAGLTYLIVQWAGEEQLSAACPGWPEARA
jgi:hypothetical protein